MTGYVVNLPDIDVSSYRAIAINGISVNIRGLRDILALNSLAPGWNMSITGSPNPSRIMYSSTQVINTEWVAIVNITYNASDSITSMAYQYSNDSVTGLANSGNWYDLNDAAGLNIQTFTYDVNGDLDYTTWS